MAYNYLEAVVKNYEDFQKEHTTPEQHKEFLDSLPTAPTFRGRVEMNRKDFLETSWADFDLLLEREITYLRADMRRLRTYMKAKGF